MEGEWGWAGGWEGSGEGMKGDWEESGGTGWEKDGQWQGLLHTSIAPRLLITK